MQLRSSVLPDPSMQFETPRMRCNRFEAKNARSAPFYSWNRSEGLANNRVFCHFWQSSGKMTAQEQMKKMLDELMGTQRDGECKRCDVKVKLARNVLTEFYDLARLYFCLSFFLLGYFCILTK